MNKCCTYDNMIQSPYDMTMECKVCHTKYTDDYLLYRNLKKYSRPEAASWFKEPELTPIEKLDKLCSEFDYYLKHGKLPDWG